jgi:hypothetical protein
MSKHLLKLASLFSLLLAVAFVTPQRALADDDDPPSRVARLSIADGSVSFQPAGTDDWVNAIINRPLTTGDKLWADSDSRAELHLGSASIRISSNTGISFLNLTDDNTQIRLSAGTVRVRVKRLDDNENFEIDAPNLAFSILRPGVYTIHVNANGDSTVVRVRKGEGEVTGGGSAFTVHSHEVGTFNGTDELSADFNGYRSYDDDDFDAWCADRDRHEDLSISRRYVSPDVIGYEDLDDHGGWRPVPEYGEVWFPHTTIVGWAPYRYGHWAYVYPWGYTWIDDAPWGFAPFHYGRWINYNGVWGWVPCPPPRPDVVYVRPVYAPALVAWVGGPHFGVGIAIGGGANVGWFPLGPREVYVPSYPVSRTYINNVNVSNTTVNTTVINNYYNTTVINRNTTIVNNNVNVTQVHQTYVNQSVPGAVTATTPQAFTSAQSVAKNVVKVDARQVASAPVSAFTPPVAPVKQAVLGSGSVAAVKPPTVIENRAVVAKVAPPPPPVPFVKEQQAIQANGGKPLAIAQVKQIQTQSPPPPAAHQVTVAPPAVHQNPQGNPVGQNPPGGGFKPFTKGGGSDAGPAAQPGSGSYKPGPVNAGPPAGNKPGNVANIPSNAVNNSNNPSNAGQPPAGYKPGNVGNNPVNPPGSGPNQGPGAGQKSYNDRPPSSRPYTAVGGPANTNAQFDQKQQQLEQKQQQLDQRHQQQIEDLRSKQDQERQKLEQQQIQQRQMSQKAADEARQKQLDQQREQQLLAQKAADQARQKQLDQQHEQQLQAQKAAEEARQQQLYQKQQQQLQTMELKHDNQQQKLDQKQQVERQKTAPPPSKPQKDDHAGQKDDHAGHDHR